MKLQIQSVTFELRHEFAAILAEANAWQKARGSEGWTGPFDDNWMIPRIERGELFLALVEGEPAACFRILYADRSIWGDREVGDSIYLHTFAVRRSKAGLGIGSAVIDLVAGIGRERGLAKLRLDCFLGNSRLVSFYGRNGFASVGSTEVAGKTLALMERPIDARATPL